jgi:DNA modification methylase
MENKIILGNCLDKLKELDSNSVDSIVTDPPYELGFMGKSWDNTGIANNVEMWKECLRVLKPGGHLLSFGGTRTYHRMAVAIEDAGFEIRDMIEWVYGSGFPKSLNIGKAVDKLQGNEREEKDVTFPDGSKPRKTAGHFTVGENIPRNTKYTKGTSEWEGWGTALKPAHEPICMARKPLSEKTVAENVLKYGTGGINIDESRVGTEDTRQKTGGAIEGSGWGTKGGAIAGSELGRFPANLIHDNSEEVTECFPDTKSQGHWSKTKTTGFGEFGNGSSEYLGVGEKDKEGGNASRFFKSIIYQAKASKSERDKGCESIEEKDIVTFATANGTSGKPSSISEGRETKYRNNHPTVKPIKLMEYLIKLVTPKGGIVLDPFAGSGTTLVSAKQNGFRYIGIEMTEEYIPIIEARLNSVNNLQKDL